jgi:hypothetical protein
MAFSLRLKKDAAKGKGGRKNKIADAIIRVGMASIFEKG